jgi:hypothetical protein
VTKTAATPKPSSVAIYQAEPALSWNHLSFQVSGNATPFTELIWSFGSSERITFNHKGKPQELPFFVLVHGERIVERILLAVCLRSRIYYECNGTGGRQKILGLCDVDSVKEIRIWQFHL